MQRRGATTATRRATAPPGGADVLARERAPFPVVPALVLGALASIGCMQPYRQTLDPEFIKRVDARWPDLAYTLNAEDVDRLYYTNAMVGLSPQWDRQTVRVTLERPEDPTISVTDNRPGVVARAGKSGIAYYNQDESRTKVIHSVHLFIFPPESMTGGHPVLTTLIDGAPFGHTTMGYAENAVNTTPAGSLGLHRYRDDVVVQSIDGADPFAGQTAPVWMYSIIAPADAELAFEIQWRPNPAIGALD